MDSFDADTYIQLPDKRRLRSILRKIDDNPDDKSSLFPQILAMAGTQVRTDVIREIFFNYGSRFSLVASSRIMRYGEAFIAAVSQDQRAEEDTFLTRLFDFISFAPSKQDTVQ